MTKMLDGDDMTVEEFMAFLEKLEKEGPIPARQSEEEAEASWQRYKKDHNIQ